MNRSLCPYSPPPPPFSSPSLFSPLPSIFRELVVRISRDRASVYVPRAGFPRPSVCAAALLRETTTKTTTTTTTNKKKWRLRTRCSLSFRLRARRSRSDFCTRALSPFYEPRAHHARASLFPGESTLQLSQLFSFPRSARVKERSIRNENGVPRKREMKDGAVSGWEDESFCVCLWFLRELALLENSS